jgi:hypothetical protein
LSRLLVENGRLIAFLLVHYSRGETAGFNASKNFTIREVLQRRQMTVIDFAGLEGDGDGAQWIGGPPSLLHPYTELHNTS